MICRSMTIKAKVSAADAYAVNYVGMDLTVDGFVVASSPAIPRLSPLQSQQSARSVIARSS